ncbi:MAG: TAXI family TRAP transporter solute-binding subunit [Synergistaceae bacterium]|nr:TAXI family TRAP transporter solute-binding subunit [Synergistaceae bacterium]
MKRLCLICAVFIFVFFASALPAPAGTYIYIATGGTGGTYYPLGGSIADIVSKNVPDLQVTSETGNASSANIKLISAGQVEMALAQNDIAYWARKGMPPFAEKHENIRVVASLYPEHVHCIFMKGDDISDIEDLRGKRVSVGAPDSGVLGDVSAILRSARMEMGDLSADFLDFNSTTQNFKDGRLDAGFVVAGYPTSSITDLAATKNIDLLSFNDDFLDTLREEFPFFIKSTIPAGTYRGIDRDVSTPAVLAMLICDASLPDDVVYRFTKAFWENLADLRKAHPQADHIHLETALDGATIPVHPGAARYYAEVGMEIPEIK